MSAATAEVVGLEASSDARDSPTRWPRRASRWSLAAAAAAAILREGDAGNIDGDGDAAGAREEAPFRGGLRGGSRRAGDSRRASAAAMAAARATRPREGDAQSARASRPSAETLPPRGATTWLRLGGCPAERPPEGRFEARGRGRLRRRAPRERRAAVESRPPPADRPAADALARTPPAGGLARCEQPRRTMRRAIKSNNDVSVRAGVADSAERPEVCQHRPIKPRAPIAKKKYFDRF